MQFSRVSLHKYAKSVVGYFHQQSEKLADGDWLKDSMNRRMERAQHFTDTFEKTDGETLEQIERSSKKRGLMKAGGRALLAVGAAAAFGTAMATVVAGPLLGSLCVLGAAGSIVVGATAAGDSLEKEEDFRFQLKGLASDMADNKEPHIHSAKTPRRARPKSSSNDLMDPTNPIGFTHPNSLWNPANALSVK